MDFIELHFFCSKLFSTMLKLSDNLGTPLEKFAQIYKLGVPILSSSSVYLQAKCIDLLITLGDIDNRISLQFDWLGVFCIRTLFLLFMRVQREKMGKRLGREWEIVSKFCFQY